MIKKFITPLCVSILAIAPLKAGFSEGMILGGFAGLTTGLVATAIAQNCKKPDVVVYEEPVVVEKPVVVYQEPTYVVHQQPRVIHTRSCRAQRANLAVREDRVRRAEMKQAIIKREAELLVEEEAQLKARKRALKNGSQKEIVRETVVEKQVVAAQDSSIKLRELALKERQLELDL